MAITLNGTTGITNDGGYTGDGVSFADTTPANTLVTTTDGNVGVGTASPSERLDIYNPAGNVSIRFRNSTVSGGYINYITSDALLFQTASTERMRIDSSGNLLVGTTNATEYSTTQAGVVSQHVSGSKSAFKAVTATTAAASLITFVNPNGAVGSITTTGSATAFNTSSDYRLKENIAPMTGALGVVQQLKPVTYNWKVDGSSGQGFIAHELQAVVPDCVQGEKDAVDAEGNPQYQGIDTSFLVATLTSAIQELKAIVDAQAIEIQALKGAA